jgi:hypothetical protein
MEPGTNPRVTFGPWPTIPFATKALCFAFAAVSTFLLFLDYNK